MPRLWSEPHRSRANIADTARDRRASGPNHDRPSRYQKPVPLRARLANSRLSDRRSRLARAAGSREVGAPIEVADCGGGNCETARVLYAVTQVSCRGFAAPLGEGCASAQDRLSVRLPRHSDAQRPRRPLTCSDWVVGTCRLGRVRAGGGRRSARGFVRACPIVVMAGWRIGTVFYIASLMPRRMSQMLTG